MGSNYAIEPVVIVCADDRLGAQRWDDAAAGLGARVGCVLAIEEAAAALDEGLSADVVLVEVAADAGAPLDRLLGLLEAAARERRHPSIVVIPPALIDIATARTPHADVAILCDAGPLERSAALGLALAARPAAMLREAGEEPPLQLRRLSEEVGRIARALAALSAGDPPPPPPAYLAPIAGPITLPAAAAVRATIRARRMRDHYFQPSLFADPAWDMLLDLLLARVEERMVAVSSLCIAAAVPPTTALRWIKRLTDEGLFIRQADPRDGRRVFIDLGEHALRGMAAYFQSLERLGATAP